MESDGDTRLDGEGEGDGQGDGEVVSDNDSEAEADTDAVVDSEAETEGDNVTVLLALISGETVISKPLPTPFTDTANDSGYCCAIDDPC